MSTSLITEAQEAIRAIGGDWPRDMKRPEWISQVARATSLTKSAVERILYGKRKRLYADEYLTLKEKLSALQERRANHESAYARLEQRAAERAGSTPAAGNEESPRRDGATRGGGGEMPARAGAVDAA